MKTNIKKYIFFDTTNIKKDIQKIASAFLLAIYGINLLSPLKISEAGSSEIIYPLKEISKLECRFNNFDTLWSECKQNLPILYTADYVKYATLNEWYNEFTRLYTVLWWASYKYWWDIWNGWHEWVDIATAEWTPVYAMADWTVLKAGEDWMLWNSIVIQHIINWQTIISSYSHLSKIEVNKWEIVSVWRKIWEVWSTWNSSWNHLHFQIDTTTAFGTPAYYDYKTCPYSYYQITEEWVCFQQLKQMTIDPLLFLETKWAVLSNLPTYETSPTADLASNWVDMSVFNRTVNVGYSINDIKTVQQIMKDLWYYKWLVTWNYNDVIESVIDYQVARGVIATRTSDWAWNFGPATRKQAKADYENYLASGSISNNQTIANNTDNNTSVWSTEQVIISKEKLMTREEIEAKEVEDFIKDYNINLSFKNVAGNIAVWEKEIINLEITDKRKWKPFIWNMPWWMSFIVNTETVELFPTKLFSFTDWKREIEVKWLKEWNTKLYIKVWTVTVKTFDINVYNWNKTIYPEEAQLFSPSVSVIWEIQTAIAFFRDWNKQLLVNVPFGSTFKLQASEWNKVCIKSWDVKDIKSIYATKCNDEDFKTEINFTYADTVYWLLIYDFKILNKNANFQIVNTYDNALLVEKKVWAQNPKWLTNDYEYKNEVMTMLEQWFISWIKSWYFQENSELTQYDAYTWLRNSLININNATNPNESNKSKIESNLREVASLQKWASKYTTITRWEFLNMASKYLVLDMKNVNVSIVYKDLSEEQNKVANYIFNQNTTWKDDFWKSYFQPDKKITRWEWAYMLSTTLNNHYSSIYLTLK